jgi:hypothetical protein
MKDFRLERFFAQIMSLDDRGSVDRGYALIDAAEARECYEAHRAWMASITNGQTDARRDQPRRLSEGAGTRGESPVMGALARSGLNRARAKLAALSQRGADRVANRHARQGDQQMSEEDKIAVEEFEADMRDHKDEILAGLRDERGKVIPPRGTKVTIIWGNIPSDAGIYRLFQIKAAIDAWKAWRKTASA